MTNIAMLSCAHIHTKGYLETITKRDDCKLAAVWDDVPDRGQRYAAEYHAPFVTDLAEAVARPDVDAFVICAENTRHLPLLAAAVPAGKPIFCEKPFTASVQDAREALALIRKHGTIVHMGYAVPFAPEMQGIAKLLAGGALGRVTHGRFRNSHHAAYGGWFGHKDLAWFTDPALAGGGAFMDMGTHAVHCLRTLLGPVEAVNATIRNFSGVYPRVDDFGHAQLRFTSGAIVVAEAAWVQTGGIGGLELIGSKAAVFNLPPGGYVLVEPGKPSAKVADAPGKPSRVERLLAAVDGTISKREFDADLLCAADAVAIVQACYESAKTGKWVDVASVQ